MTRAIRPVLLLVALSSCGGATHAELLRDGRWVEACQAEQGATMARYVETRGDELQVELYALGDDEIVTLLGSRPERLAGLVVVRWRRPADGALRATFTGVDRGDGTRHRGTTDAFEVMDSPPSPGPEPSGRGAASGLTTMGELVVRGATLGTVNLPLTRALETLVGRARGARQALAQEPGVRRDRATFRMLSELLQEQSCQTRDDVLTCEAYVALLPPEADEVADEEVATWVLTAEFFGDELCEADQDIVLDLPPGATMSQRLNALFSEPVTARSMW